MQTPDTASTTPGPSTCNRCGAANPGVLAKTEDGDLVLVCKGCDDYEPTNGDRSDSTWEWIRGRLAPLFGGADDRRAE
jgi:hypothetical protein